MISFPFDSVYNEGTSSYDRAIDSKIYAKMINEKFKNGVFPDAQDEFEVTAGTGLKVIVKKGSAMIQGRFALEDENQTELTLDAADSTYPRIDRIILRMDDNLATRSITLMVLKGTAASEPVVPTLTRTENVYDISLAKVNIAATAISINSDNITDERPDVSVCGWVTSVTGIVPLSQGGTGASVVATARENLEVPYYEEGTWTPKLYEWGSETAIWTGTGNYKRVGNLVSVRGYISLTPVSIGTFNVLISGVPFTTSRTPGSGTFDNDTLSISNGFTTLISGDVIFLLSTAGIITSNGLVQTSTLRLEITYMI